MKRLVSLALVPVACSAGERRFPLRDPMWRDTDLQSVYAKCHKTPSTADPSHVACTPEPYDATLYWDGADNMFFRPLSEALGLVASGESINVNSLDEAPDSSWFTNRIGKAITSEELRRYACRPEQMLAPDAAAERSWLIDKGKESGSTPGFRMVVPGQGKYLVKANPANVQERQIAATILGEAVFWAAGYNASCEQAVYVRPSVFRLKPGLRAKHGNFANTTSIRRRSTRCSRAPRTRSGSFG